MTSDLGVVCTVGSLSQCVLFWAGTTWKNVKIRRVFDPHDLSRTTVFFSDTLTTPRWLSSSRDIVCYMQLGRTSVNDLVKSLGLWKNTCWWRSYPDKPCKSWHTHAYPMHHFRICTGGAGLYPANDSTTSLYHKWWFVGNSYVLLLNSAKHCHSWPKLK